MSGGNFKLPRELSHQKDGEVTRLPFSRIRFIFMEAIKISRDLHLNCGLSTLVSIAAVIALHTTVCVTFLLAYWRKWYILIGKLLNHSFFVCGQRNCLSKKEKVGGKE